MPRAIVYPHKLAALQARAEDVAADRSEVYGRRGAADDETPPPQTADDWAARVVKHVPAEVLPVFLLVTSLGDLPDAARGAFLAFFVAAAIWRNRRNNKRLEPSELRPQGWIHDAFASTAFLAWALGTSEPTRELIGCSPGLGTGIMIVVAWTLGEVDTYLAERFDPAPSLAAGIK